MKCRRRRRRKKKEIKETNKDKKEPQNVSWAHQRTSPDIFVIIIIIYVGANNLTI